LKVAALQVASLLDTKRASRTNFLPPDATPPAQHARGHTDNQSRCTLSVSTLWSSTNYGMRHRRHRRQAANSVRTCRDAQAHPQPRHYTTNLTRCKYERPHCDPRTASCFDVHSMDDFDDDRAVEARGNNKGQANNATTTTTAPSSLTLQTIYTHFLSAIAYSDNTTGAPTVTVHAIAPTMIMQKTR